MWPRFLVEKSKRDIVSNLDQCESNQCESDARTREALMLNNHTSVNDNNRNCTIFFQFIYKITEYIRNGGLSALFVLRACLKQNGPVLKMEEHQVAEQNINYVQIMGLASRRPVVGLDNWLTDSSPMRDRTKYAIAKRHDVKFAL